MANEYGNYTIWDKVFDETGNADEAWKQYWETPENEHDWDVGNKFNWFFDNEKPEVQDQYIQIKQKEKNLGLDNQGEDDKLDGYNWGKWFENKNNQLDKAQEIKDYDNAYYDDLFSLSNKNLDSLINIDSNYNKNAEKDKEGNTKDDSLKANVKKARNDLAVAKSSLDPFTQMDTGLLGDKADVSNTAKKIYSGMQKNIEEGKDAYDNLSTALSSSENKYWKTNDDPVVNSTGEPGANLPYMQSNVYDIKNINDIDKVLEAEYFNHNINDEKFDRNISDKLSDAVKNGKGNDRLLNEYWASRNKGSNIDPRFTDSTSQNTSNAWTNLWDRYGKWKADGHYEDIDDFNKFYTSQMDESERALLEKDIANNIGFDSWADMFDVTDGGKKFSPRAKALLTGEDGVYGMKELSDSQRGEGTQRYQGQDLFEKMYGRNLNGTDQRTTRYNPETNKWDVGYGDRKMQSNQVEDLTGDQNTTVDEWAKLVTENAPDLTEMVKTSPEKIKNWVGDNTLTLNDVSKKLVNKGFQSPLFNTSQGDMTLPEADLISQLTQSKSFDKDKFEKGEYSASEFMDPRYVDYATGLLNTYLNAADLSNKDTSSGYYNNVNVPESLQQNTQAVTRANENLLNNYLNYYENKDNYGGEKSAPGSLSYNVFDDGDRFTFEDSGFENGDVDLSSLYNTGTKLTDITKKLKSGSNVGNPFNIEMLRKTINKGRR